jgi:hypothetical protein
LILEVPVELIEKIHKIKDENDGTVWHIFRQPRERVSLRADPVTRQTASITLSNLFKDKEIEGLESGDVALSIKSIKVFSKTERNHCNHET